MYYFYLIIYCFRLYNNDLELSNHHSLPSIKSVPFNLSWSNTSFVQFLFHFTFTFYKLSSSKSFPFFVDYNCIHIKYYLRRYWTLVNLFLFFSLCSSLDSFWLTGQLIIEKCLSRPVPLHLCRSLHFQLSQSMKFTRKWKLRIFSGNV